MRTDYQEPQSAPAWLRLAATLVLFLPSWFSQRLRRGHERSLAGRDPVS